MKRRTASSFAGKADPTAACPNPAAFLYNTLESIYCLAQNLEDQRIAVMTNALGKLLRSSLNDKRDVITVSEDLQVTRDYLSIQQIRYGERLQVEYDFRRIS